MEIQTVDRLCEEIADMVGVYGCCKSEPENNIQCEFGDKNIFCCRTGFVMELREKMIKAVEFDESVNIEVHTMPITDWDTTEYREQYLKEIIDYKYE